MAIDATALTGAPACARQVWCDHSSIYVEIPYTVPGTPPVILKFPFDSLGLSKVLDLLKDTRDAALPKGGSYSFSPHPAIKQVGVSNKVARDILKKLRMI